MTYKLKNSAIIGILNLLCVSTLIHASVQSDFSDIFHYDDPNSAKGLHVALHGNGWRAEDIKENHIPFHIQLFNTPEIMKGFADGQTRDPESVKQRCLSSIKDRFGQGHPHGLITVIDAKTEEPFMHLIGGGGDRPGSSEVAFAMLTAYQGRGLGFNVLSALVDTWAPEVRRIGLGIGLDEKGTNIKTAFCCFSGKELQQLDATASPSNYPSWRILVKTGFQAAACDLFSSDIVNNFSSPEIIADVEYKENPRTRRAHYEELEKSLLKFFEGQYEPKPLEPGKRYRMIDLDGNERTFSKHTKWNRIKFHFEKKVVAPEEKIRLPEEEEQISLGFF